jgi:hypothetical protein
MVFTGGSGNDKVTLTGDVSVTSTTKATTVALGAGNDSLLNSSATTTFTGATFDGGAGTDTVAISLITLGNASKFTNFETLGLDTASAGSRDVSIISGITGFDLLSNATNGTVTYTGATQAQALTVSASMAHTTHVTAIDFGSSVSGSTDAYTVTFAGTGSASSTVASPTAVSAGVISIAGIEAVTLVSGGANFTNNTIAFTDAAARTLTITGSQKTGVTFVTAFGTAGTSTTAAGVSSIDASALTGALTLNTANVATAFAGVSIKGGSNGDTITLSAQSSGNGRYTVDAGAGDDGITTSTTAATLTLGAGSDTVDATSTVAGSDFATAPVFTTITDFQAADKIILGASTAATATKTFVTGATSLVDALGLALSNVGAGVAAYFVYGGDTYVVAEDSSNALSSGDIIVKLTGITTDLSWTNTGNASGLVGIA